MLEIARGRTWVQYHTFFDSPGVPSDLTHLAQVRSQIRKKTAVRNTSGVFEHPLVVEVSCEVTDTNVIKQSLTRAQAEALETGDYLIDMVGFDADGNDEPLLDPEPVKVVNRPTKIVDLDLPDQPIPPTVPDFSEWFNEALED